MHHPASTLNKIHKLINSFFIIQAVQLDKFHTYINMSAFKSSELKWQPDYSLNLFNC